MNNRKKPPRLSDFFKAMGNKVMSQTYRNERNKKNPRLRISFYETAVLFTVPSDGMITFVQTLLSNLENERNPAVQKVMAQSFVNRLTYCNDRQLDGVRQSHYLLLQDVLTSLANGQPATQQAEAEVMLAAMRLMQCDSSPPPRFCFDLILNRLQASLAKTEHTLLFELSEAIIDTVVIRPELISKDFVKFNLALLMMPRQELSLSERLQIKRRDKAAVQPHILASAKRTEAYNESLPRFQSYAVEALKKAVRRANVELAETNLSQIFDKNSFMHVRRAMILGTVQEPIKSHVDAVAFSIDEIIQMQVLAREKHRNWLFDKFPGLLTAGLK